MTDPERTIAAQATAAGQGLPKDPQAKRIDIVNGVIEGLS